MRGTLETQLSLEQEMITAGIDRYRKTVDKAVTSKAESRTQHGQAIVARTVTAVADGIKEFILTPKSNRDITYKYVKDMDVEEVAFLSLITLIDGISVRQGLLFLANNIGSALEIQDRLDKWIAEEGSVASNTIKLALKKGVGARRYGLTHKMNKDGHKHTEWSKSDRIHVGCRMVDVIVRTTGLIELEKQRLKKTKTTTIVKATKETEEWIRGFNEYAETARPRFAPCLIVPKDWTNVTGGGYYSDYIPELPIVRRR
jgi:DNA-directed RNA polymerase